MSFIITLGFATEHDCAEFDDRIAPKVRGQLVDSPPAAADGDTLQRRSFSVTSPSAARDVCHQIVAFLSKSKKDRVTVEWTGADDKPQVGEVYAGSARDAELLAVRISAAAKAHLDREKAAAEAPA